MLRGKWILDNLLGAPPPPPPPNVPTLEEKSRGRQGAVDARAMAQHRANPACASCHAQMDPLGFALENFDAVGRWRTVNEANTPIDASGALPDGTKFDGVSGLREVLLAQPERFVTTLTEKLLTYALGRGVEYYDMPAVRQIVREAAAGELRLSSLVLGIVRQRAVSDEEGAVMIITKMRCRGGRSCAASGATVALAAARRDGAGVLAAGADGGGAGAPPRVRLHPEGREHGARGR